MVAPVNDNFANAMPITLLTNGGTWTSPAIDQTDATTESGEQNSPTISYTSRQSVWFKYIPAVSGNVTIDTELTGAGKDTQLALWSGTVFGSLTHVASDSDSGSALYTSKLTSVAVTAGTVYYIQCGVWTGNTITALVLRLTGPNTTLGLATATSIARPVGRPYNDDFDNAMPIAITSDGGTWTSGVIANANVATTETGEPAPNITHTKTKSTWYKYTPLASGTLTVDTTLETSGDTVMQVYSGTSMGALTSVGYVDEGGTSHGGPTNSSWMQCSVTAGTTYYVQVGIWAAGTVVGLQVKASGPHSVTLDQSGAVGRATQSATARTVTMAGANTIAVGRATQSATARALTATKVNTIAVGRATQSATARAVTVAATTSATVGRATSIAVARAIAVVTGQIVAVGRAAETDTARTATAVPGGVTPAVGRASAASTARAVTLVASTAVVVGRATQSAAARGVTVAATRLLAVARAAATDTAGALAGGAVSPSQTLPVGRAAATMGARPVSVLVLENLSLDVGVAWEHDGADPVVVVGGIGPDDSSVWTPDRPDLAYPEGTATVDLTAGDQWYTIRSTVDVVPILFAGESRDFVTRLYADDGTMLLHTWPSEPYEVAPETTYAVRFSSATAEVVDVEWGIGAPPSYGDRGTPVVLDPILYGADEDGHSLFATDSALADSPPSGTVGTGWWSWTAPSQQDMTFSVETGVEVVARLYVDGVLVEQVTGNEIDFDVVTVPADGVVEVAVATFTGGGIVEVTWAAAAVPEDPADYDPWDPDPPAPDGERMAVERVAQYLRVEVYERDGETLITEVPRRYAPKWQEVLNGPGNGEVGVDEDDVLWDAYPDALAYRNIVKFWLNQTCVHAFRIRKKNDTFVTDGEYAGIRTTLSGPGVLNLLDDAMVRHDGDPRPDSLSTRSYDWASKRGDWYRPGDWDAPIAVSSIADPVGGGYDPRTPAADRKRFGNPKKWPDKTAKWMFIYGDPAKNAYWGIDPSYRLPRGGWSNRYFRKGFRLEKSTLVRLYCTTDEWFTLHVDGEQVMDQRNSETGYTTFTYVDVRLAKGPHVIAIHQRSIQSPKNGDGNDATLFTAMTLDHKGKPDEVVVNSGADWEAFYGEDPPGWNKAQVLRNFVTEGRVRNVHALDAFTMDFDEDTDSDGVPWADQRFNKEVDVGTKGVELVALLAEGHGFDVWMTYGGMVLHAAKRRGKNRSHSVAIQTGRNLLDWEAESVEDVFNDYLVRYDGGYIEVKSHGSIREFGKTEGYVELGDVKHARNARRIMRGVARGIARLQEKAGTGEQKSRPSRQPSGSVIPVRGALPFLDFGVGDTISAPGNAGQPRPVRVLSLSGQEDDLGSLSYDVELEVVRHG